MLGAQPALTAFLLVLIAGAWPLLSLAADRVVVLEHYTNFR